MTPTGDRPKGAELDTFVLWAIGVLQEPEMEIWMATVQFYAALKAGRVGIDDNDPAFYKMVDRSIKRLRERGLVTFDEFYGFRLAEIPT